MAQFPQDKIFPVLDLCRFLILDATFQDTLISLIGTDFNGVYGLSPTCSDFCMALGVLAEPMTALGPHQLSLYLLTNAYAQPKCRAALLDAFKKAIDLYRGAITATSKNARVGYASLVLNAAVQMFMTGKVGAESGKKEV